MSLSFPLAPMSPLIRGLTIALWILPLGLGISAIISRQRSTLIVSLFLIILYSSIWLWCRPSQFEISPHHLKIVFPAWCRNIPMSDVSGVRILTNKTFQQEYGWTIRIGVGGLWGGFGWLWTKRQGFLEFYVSRTDNFVLIERSTGNNLLLTPTKLQEMVNIIEDKISQ